MSILRQQAEQVAVQLQEADRQLGGAAAQLESEGFFFPEEIELRTARYLDTRAALLGEVDVDDWVLGASKEDGRGNEGGISGDDDEALDPEAASPEGW